MGEFPWSPTIELLSWAFGCVHLGGRVEVGVARVGSTLAGGHETTSWEKVLMGQHEIRAMLVGLQVMLDFTSTLEDVV